MRALNTTYTKAKRTGNRAAGVVSVFFARELVNMRRPAGYQRLALEVIRQAVADAATTSREGRTLKAAETARRFLLDRRDEVTRRWFDLAGLDIDEARALWRANGFADQMARPHAWAGMPRERKRREGSTRGRRVRSDV